MNRGLGCLLITQEKSENRIMDIRSDSDGVEHDVNEFLEKHAEEIEKLRKHCPWIWKDKSYSTFQEGTTTKNDQQKTKSILAMDMSHGH